MTEKAIQSIYNGLVKWEGKNAKQAYPIHKKLKKEGFGYNDIYEWIATEYTFSPEMKILDAGCGVGYGSLYLHEKHACFVTGLSLSEEEVKKANQFAKDKKFNRKVEFKQKSFDDLEPETYDFIMAIESIKHTLDVKKTKQSLINSLKTNGILVIVDDFLIDQKPKKLIDKYAKDWALKQILTPEMFSAEFETKKDLTSYVQSKSGFSLSFWVNLLSLVQPVFKEAIIARGGFYLEKLFKMGAMKYSVIQYKKP